MCVNLFVDATKWELIFALIENVTTSIWTYSDHSVGEKKTWHVRFYVHCVCFWERLTCVIAVTDRPICKVIVWEHLKGCQSKPEQRCVKSVSLTDVCNFPFSSHTLMNTYTQVQLRRSFFWLVLKSRVSCLFCSGRCCGGITWTKRHYRTLLMLLLEYCCLWILDICKYLMCTLLLSVYSL